VVLLPQPGSFKFLLDSISLSCSTNQSSTLPSVRYSQDYACCTGYLNACMNIHSIAANEEINSQTDNERDGKCKYQIIIFLC
jgi:hypothetical protein